MSSKNKNLQKAIIEKVSNKNEVEYIIFYGSYCPYSIEAIKILQDHNLRFKGYDLDNIEGGKDFVLKVLRKLNCKNKDKLLAHNTKPIIFNKNIFVGGCSELKQYLK